MVDRIERRCARSPGLATTFEPASSAASSPKIVLRRRPLHPHEAAGSSLHDADRIAIAALPAGARCMKRVVERAVHHALAKPAITTAHGDAGPTPSCCTPPPPSSTPRERLSRPSIATDRRLSLISGAEA